MNIYLDIDGVLLINENHLAPHAEEFLLTVLAKHPDTTYWLTTHCWRGENRVIDVLRPYLKPVTVQLLHKIKPTEWGEFKTDAIDFSGPFLWFDDDLYGEEKKALHSHFALDNWIEVDLNKDPNQLSKFITSFPIPSTPITRRIDFYTFPEELANKFDKDEVKGQDRPSNPKTLKIEMENIEDFFYEACSLGIYTNYKISAALIMRRLKVTPEFANILIEEMEKRGVVSKDKNRPRDILIKSINEAKW